MQDYNISAVPGCIIYILFVMSRMLLCYLMPKKCQRHPLPDSSVLTSYSKDESKSPARRGWAVLQGSRATSQQVPSSREYLGTNRSPQHKLCPGPLHVLPARPAVSLYKLLEIAIVNYRSMKSGHI